MYIGVLQYAQFLMRFNFKNKIIFNCTLKCSGKATDLTKTIHKTIHKTIVAITYKFTKSCNRDDQYILGLLHRDYSKETYEDNSPLGSKIGECHHSCPPNSLQCLCCCSISSCKRLFPITTCPSSFLKIFPDGAWWSNMNDISD